jgi:hypothetical protein
MRFLLLALPIVLAVCAAGTAQAGVGAPSSLVAQAEPAPAAPAATPAPAEENTDEDAAEGASGEARSQPGNPVLGANGLPEVYYGDAVLPEPVRQLREKLLEAAESGDIEKLRPFLEGDQPPLISVGEGQSDPIDFLRSQAGDPEGREILAILTEVLQAGYVHLDPGTPQETYAWPYFAYYPLDKLSPPQMVEMFKIITGQDFADMKEYGQYVFFRLGISPQGKWQFFISGD